MARIDFEALGLGTSASNSVFQIKEDKYNNIWIGTDNGLFKFSRDDKQYSRIGVSSDSSKALNSQDVNSLYADEFGTIWVGTWLGGLNKIDQRTGKIKSYTKKEGLNTHSVQGILGDENNGALWLSGFDGISRFDLKNETFQHFDMEDGVHGNQFADRSALKTSDGFMVFGGQNGFTMLKPEEIKNDIITPSILITDFKIFNERITPGENSVLEKPIYDTESVTLNYDENDISFEFLAIHYTNPAKNKYAYRLINYQDEWRYVGNQRSAAYPNLPPGDYIFQVKASNNNDVWNEEGKSLSIIITPPLWATWLAYTLYLFLILSILYSFRKFEISRQKKNSEIKESQLRAEAAEAHSLIIQAENERKTKELEEARELQLSMLPKELPQLPNFDIAVYMKTATEVGGDYYDFNVSMDGTLTVVLGDATGHGMKAGTMVTAAKSLFNSYSGNDDILFTFQEMTRCIKQMHFQNLSMCMTMIKLNSNQLRMSSAGMPPIYIYRSNTSSVEEHLFEGMPLGTMNKFPYVVRETSLNKGDTILLMSDGFPELVNEKNEMFGYKRSKRFFEEILIEAPEDVISKLKNAGAEWVNDKDPDDDVTFVVIKVK